MYVNLKSIWHKLFYKISGHRERSYVKMKELSLEILQYLLEHSCSNALQNKVFFYAVKWV